MKAEDQLKAAQDFINKVAFTYLPHCGDVLSQCKKCGKSAWMRKDIKHRKGCEIGIILAGYNVKGKK